MQINKKYEKLWCKYAYVHWLTYLGRAHETISYALENSVGLCNEYKYLENDTEDGEEQEENE